MYLCRTVLSTLSPQSLKQGFPISSSSVAGCFGTVHIQRDSGPSGSSMSESESNETCSSDDSGQNGGALQSLSDEDQMSFHYHWSRVIHKEPWLQNPQETYFRPYCYNIKYNNNYTWRKENL